MIISLNNLLFKTITGVAYTMRRGWAVMNGLWTTFEQLPFIRLCYIFILVWRTLLISHSNFIKKIKPEIHI